MSAAAPAGRDREQGGGRRLRRRARGQLGTSPKEKEKNTIEAFSTACQKSLI